MKYTPHLTDKEIEDNHKLFAERAALFKENGYDLAQTRRFLLEKAQPLEGSILEIGSGRGHTALALAKAGYKVMSIDKDKESLKTAVMNLAYEKLLSNATFFIMDARAMDFLSGAFNNVIAVNLLHHIDEIDKVFVEMDRVLCAGGKLIIADFNEKGMNFINRIHKNEGRVHDDSGHGKDYCHSYFEGSGYKVDIYEETMFWVLAAKKQFGKV